MRQWSANPGNATLEAAADLSFADIHAAVDDARKKAILDGRDTPGHGEVHEVLSEFAAIVAER
ncbi:MAG TPA: hypothetical protein VFQ44_15940 [Streptosporangiaceae bacterium]|nr:hypothetical protein [Streptosporangiaceae bacterium]